MTNYQIIDNVKILIHAELGHRTIPFPDLLSLEPGSILEMHRPTGENVDIYAGKVLLGNGEIAVIEANLAVRVADLRREESEAARGISA
jgi:flagellar motor switch protein FliN/FliY